MPLSPARIACHCRSAFTFVRPLSSSCVVPACAPTYGSPPTVVARAIDSAAALASCGSGGTCSADALGDSSCGARIPSAAGGGRQARESATTSAVTTAAPSEFYMRDLPSACVPFTSAEGKKLFGEALSSGTMESFFPLAAQFRTRECRGRARAVRSCRRHAADRARLDDCSCGATVRPAARPAGPLHVSFNLRPILPTLSPRAEEDPAFCGLSTLVMTLNALSIDPRRLWKGPWRWFSEDMVRGEAGVYVEGSATRGHSGCV